MNTPKKVKYPKQIGACIDLLYQNRAERLEFNKTLDNMKAAEAALEEHILNQFTKDELRGAKGDYATASVKVDQVVNVTDWDAYLAYAVKNKYWDLVRRQPASLAVKERWKNGVEVPGVEPFGKVSLSLTKAS